jgi:hypothetical protein
MSAPRVSLHSAPRRYNGVMAKRTKKPKKKSTPARQAEPAKPSNLLSQNPEDAMKRMLGGGSATNERNRMHGDMHTRPNSSKALGQPRQRGRRV